MSAPTDSRTGWVGQLLMHPDRLPGVLAELFARTVTAPRIAAAVVLVVSVVAGFEVLLRARDRRWAAGARQVVVLVPPTVDPAGAVGLWSHLGGVLRPARHRILFGQPHFGFEYTMTPDSGVAIRIWVPATVPHGLVERAVESAWPGARTRTLPTAQPPLPTPRGRCVLLGGTLRLDRREALPIRIDYGGGDLVRDLIITGSDLRDGQAGCVQILARPVTGRRVRRTARPRTVSHPARLLGDLLDLLTPTTTRSSRPAPTTTDRQLTMAQSTASRAAATKSLGTHWDTVIRYAITTTIAPDADRAEISKARRRARGRAHALATVFAACTDHNYYRRHRCPRLGTALAQRRLRRGDLLSVAELATLAHLPYDPTLAGVQRAGARAVAPVAEIASGGAHTKGLGIADATGRPVALRVADARQHLHILGPTGVGKSTLLAQLILEDADKGRAVVVVDPKGDLITDVLDRLPRHCADRLVVFDADAKSAPPCLNPLDIAGTDIDLGVDNLVTIFHRIYAQNWGPRTDDVLRASLLTVCAQPGVATLADLPALLIDDANRHRLTRTITDPVLRGFWDSYEELSGAGRAQVIGPLLNKLRAFLLRPFVKAAIAAGPSSVDLGQVLDHGGICLARLPKGSLGEDTTRLMGSLIVARIWQATTARIRTPGPSRRDASLILDEAHNFLNLSTPVEDMLAEARGLRLSLVLAHQNLSQLSRELRDALSANARSKIFFTASPEDARELARHTLPWLSEHDLTHLDAYHAAARLVVAGQQAPPFTLATRPLPDPIPHRATDIQHQPHPRPDTPTRHPATSPAGTGSAPTPPRVTDPRVS